MKQGHWLPGAFRLYAVIDCAIVSFIVFLHLLDSLQHPWCSVFVEHSQITLFVYLVSFVQFLDSLLNLPQPNHLSPTINKNFLKVFNLSRPSFESRSTSSLWVVIAAALNNIKMTKGGTQSSSIECAPVVKVSTELFMVERTHTSDVVATVLQSPLVPAVKDTFVPFSNASSRTLIQS